MTQKYGARLALDRSTSAARSSAMDAQSSDMITYRLGLRIIGKASHAPWRNQSVSPTPTGEGAGEAFFIRHGNNAN